MAEKQDWRNCQEEVQAFKKCMSNYEERRFADKYASWRHHDPITSKHFVVIFLMQLIFSRYYIQVANKTFPY